MRYQIDFSCPLEMPFYFSLSAWHEAGDVIDLDERAINAARQNPGQTSIELYNYMFTKDKIYAARLFLRLEYVFGQEKHHAKKEKFRTPIKQETENSAKRAGTP